MCLAIPACIVEIQNGDQAIVEIGGVRKECSLVLLENAQVGEYVIMHAGFALSRLDPEEAAETLALFARMGQEAA